jgi:hypothetical protein
MMSVMSTVFWYAECLYDECHILCNVYCDYAGSVVILTILVKWVASFKFSLLLKIDLHNTQTLQLN